jgi:sarcosine oxidase
LRPAVNSDSVVDSVDVIVVGLGALGSAAAYHLARRGQQVVGLDSYPRNHANGSSHGRTRMIREIAGVDEYVALLRRTYELWRLLEEESGRPLLRTNGQLTIGPPDDERMAMFIDAAHRHGLAAEELGGSEVGARFPGFELRDDLVALYEPNAGTLALEDCVAAHLDLAAGHGADLRHGVEVVEWHSEGGRVRVETAGGSFSAERLVITVGPWAPEVLADLTLPLSVQRIVNVHYQPIEPEKYRPDNCPNFSFHLPDGQYYGVPDSPGHGVKVGGVIDRELCTPETIRREVGEAEIDRYRSVLDRYLPGASGPVLKTLTCMYTLTADGQLIIDSMPGSRNVVYAGGCNGHAFKLAAVLGEVLADLAVDGRTRHDIARFSAARFG